MNGRLHTLEDDESRRVDEQLNGFVAAGEDLEREYQSSRSFGKGVGSTTSGPGLHARSERKAPAASVTKISRSDPRLSSIRTSGIGLPVRRSLRTP